MPVSNDNHDANNDINEFSKAKGFMETQRNRNLQHNLVISNGFGKKKFYFPEFNKKQISLSHYTIPEKILDHCDDEPHRGHKHFHKHEFHHLDENQNTSFNAYELKTVECSQKMECFLSPKELTTEMAAKAEDSVIIDKMSLQTTKLRVQNICCPKEARIVEEELGKLTGVNAIRLNVMGRVVYVSHDQENVTPIKIVETLNRRHLGASIVEAGEEDEELQRFPRNLKILLVLMIVQILLFATVIAASAYHLSWYRWLAIVQISVGMLPILKKVYHALYHKRIDLNVLITVTVIGTLGIELWTEGSAVVFVFVTANFLQEFCFYRVQKTISSLMLAKPSKAVMACTGERVAIEDVTIGSIIAVRQGELIPLDGTVVKGRASVDESSISGEAIPVEKTRSSKAYSGTVIQNGYLEIETTSLSTTSTISKISTLVQDAQLNVSPTQIMMDKFASYYTPVVVLTAAFVFLIPCILHYTGVYRVNIEIWGERALIVLVTACPCALLMATPVVVICGISGAARNGILIKGGTFLEALSRIKFLAFDKTGTLTEGKFKVVDVISVSDHEKTDVMRWSAALESMSSHPLAAAVVTKFTGDCIADFVNDVSAVQLPDVNDFRTWEGQGISGVVDDHRIDIGNLATLERLNIELVSEFENEYSRLSSESKTVIFVCVDEKLALMIALADTVREESVAALRSLKDLGVHLSMLTGDSEQTAIAVQKELKLHSVVADMKPVDKLKWITKIREDNTLKKTRCYCCCVGINVPLVGMVGDGVNDGPALAAADVGIVMAAGGSALAIEAAGVAIMANSVVKVPQMISLSRFCRNLIRGNIVLAILLKLVFLTIAIAGYVQVWMAVVADLTSLLVVIFNGLRPLAWKLPLNEKQEDKALTIEHIKPDRALVIQNHDSIVEP